MSSCVYLALVPLLVAPGTYAADDCWSVADAQARIARLESQMTARDPYTGKAQSEAKLAQYRQQIALERQFIQQRSEVNCAPTADAAHPAQAPCPAAPHAR